MADKEEENKMIPEPAVKSTQQAAQTAASEQPEPEMSRGEKWYNRLVYQGLNYWVNLGLSLYITDLFVHGGGKLDPSRLWQKDGGWFKAKYKNGVRGIMNAFTGLLGGGENGRARAKRFGEIAIGTFTLNSGGNILLIPTKFLEDYKRPIVHWLNKYVFGEKQLAADGHEKTPDEIYIKEEQPKQSWLRMITRRALGFAVTTSTGLLIDWGLKQKLDKPYRDEDGVLVKYKVGQDVFTEAAVGGVNYTLTAAGGSEIKGTPKRYLAYASLDWIYTVMTSWILHRTNGAHKKHMPKEIDGEVIPQAPAPYIPEKPAMPERKYAGDVVKPRERDITPAASHAEMAKRTNDSNHTLAT